MNKKYIVRLAPEEREQLKASVSKGKTAAYKLKHAHILLMADADGQDWADARIAQALSVHPNTARGVRQRFVEGGVEAALERKSPLSTFAPTAVGQCPGSLLDCLAL